MKAKQQQQLLATSSAQTQQQLQQVQRFLKSFDANHLEMEKTANTLNELRNFRQAPKTGKFNISTKFLRRPRNKMKTQHQVTSTTTTPANTQLNATTDFKKLNSNNNHNCSSSSSSSNNNIQIINNNITNNNNDESIAKLKDFSIDSLLNH